MTLGRRRALLGVSLALAGCQAGTSIGSSASGPVPGGTPTPAPSMRPSTTPVASATPTATRTPTAAPTPTATPTPTAPPVGPPATSSIYLGDIGAGAVLIYSSAASGATSPSAAIAGSKTGFTDSSGTSPIYGIAVDSKGTVYVLTQSTDPTGTSIVAETVLVYAAGTTGNVAPTRSISLGTAIDAESLAVSGANLYVTDDSGPGAIDVYDASTNGAARPSRSFTSDPAFANLPLKVSIDPAGHAFVSTYDQTATASAEATQEVAEFAESASGATAPLAVISGSATGLGAGVLDAAVVDANDRIDAVLDDATTDTTADVDEFAAGSSGNVSPALAFADTGSGGPVDAAVDAANDLVITETTNDASSARARVYAAGSATASRTILASEAELPLVAIGPYVAPSASGTMPLRAGHPFGHDFPRWSLRARVAHQQIIRARSSAAAMRSGPSDSMR